MLLTTDIDNKVVATGGSAVYSEAGMNRLCKSGPVVFLNVPAEAASLARDIRFTGDLCSMGERLAYL